jgi:glycosyltransferase involved in cell wall biosynthesis
VRIGVVIPAYNAVSWIGDAIASVIAQTHRDWRLVIVDDGSRDDTGRAAARFVDPRIRLIRQANTGVSAARNAGMSELAGAGACDALLFLDADDWLAPDALSRLAAALSAAPAAVAAAGPCAFVDTKVVRRVLSGDLLRRLLVRNLFANGGHLLLRADAVRSAGGFRAGLSFGEDWELWVRIALQGCFTAARGRAPVLFVRRHAGGAYRRLAADPVAFAPCMNAIFANRALRARFGTQRLAAIRRRTEAENAWIIGRELIRNGSRTEGVDRLRCSVGASPTAKRVLLLALGHVVGVLPAAWQGPFRAYDTRRTGYGPSTTTGGA